MNWLLIDLVLALVLALLSAYKKEGANKTPAFVIGFIVGLFPLINLIGIAIVLLPKRTNRNTARN